MTRLAVLSNINMDPLRNQLLKMGSFELYMAGYNQWQNELLDRSSRLHSFAPEFIFIYLDATELRSYTADLFSSIEAFAQTHEGTYFLVSNFSFPPYSVSTYSGNDSLQEAGLNSELAAFALDKENMFILDFNRLIRLHGYRNLFDDKFWYLGRMKHSQQGFVRLAQEVMNVLNCLKGQSKKVLVLDVDNTLWGGVVGEDGWQHIQLSQEGPGRVFLDFQKKIKLLQQTGVLLAICSKNNEKDVREAFSKNRNIQLSWDDFICHEINWNLKSENIVRIASSLDLGLSSMVFLDDHPVERELIRQSLPDVTVVDFPKDISQLNQWFVTEVVYPYFGKRKLTREDVDKTQQYKRNISRKEIRKQLDYQEFLKQLRIRLTLFPPPVELCDRMAQLTQKTNQFNLTMNRYTAQEINVMLGTPGIKLVACEYEDKFGNEGIIGCSILKVEAGKALIDTFLISCRVLGRGVESDLLQHILGLLRQENIPTVEGYYTETVRNVVARNFYLENGFTALGHNRFIKTLE